VRLRLHVTDRLGRDGRQVHDDVQLLSEYRIVHFEERGGAKRPFVPYETVRIEVELGTPIGSGSSTPDG
jgi:predicted transcriptional regulator